MVMLCLVENVKTDETGDDEEDEVLLRIPRSPDDGPSTTGEKRKKLNDIKSVVDTAQFYRSPTRKSLSSSPLFVWLVASFCMDIEERIISFQADTYLATIL